MADQTHWSEQTKMLVRRHIASAAAAITNAAGTDSPYDISIERATRLLTALANAGVLADPAGEGSIYAVVKTVPGREFEILADLCTDVHEVRQWVADLHADPDRDPLATYTAYRLVEVTNA